MSALVDMNVIRNQKQNTETSDLGFKGLQCITVQTGTWERCYGAFLMDLIAVLLSGCVVQTLVRVESDDNDILKKCEGSIWVSHHIIYFDLIVQKVLLELALPIK